MCRVLKFKHSNLDKGTTVIHLTVNLECIIRDTNIKQKVVTLSLKKSILMNRILLHVSYIGTAFNGVTFIEPYYKFRDLRTVQGVLENAVKYESILFLFYI